METIWKEIKNTPIDSASLGELFPKHKYKNNKISALEKRGTYSAEAGALRTRDKDDWAATIIGIDRQPLIRSLLRVYEYRIAILRTYP